jgi:trans-aconitate methyltransferase
MSNSIGSSSDRVEEGDGDQSVKEWSSIQQVSFYLNKAANLPQRTEGEAILFDLIPKDVKRVIDLGTGDGHLLKLLKRQLPHIKATALDVSPIMSLKQHIHFFNAIGHTIETEDKSDKLLSTEEQLKWLKEIGFIDVDCYWKWLEMALLVGYKT